MDLNAEDKSWMDADAMVPRRRSEMNPKELFARLLFELQEDLRKKDDEIGNTEDDIEEVNQKVEALAKKKESVDEAIEQQNAKTGKLEEEIAEMRQFIELDEQNAALMRQVDAANGTVAEREGEFLRKCDELVAERDSVADYQKETMKIFDELRLEVEQTIIEVMAADHFRARQEIAVNPISAMNDLLSIAEEREEVSCAGLGESERLECESERHQRIIEAVSETYEAQLQEVVAEKSALRAEMEAAWAYEVQLLHRSMAKCREVEKEVKFHEKRGTMKKATTKLTGAEQRMHEQVADLHRALADLQKEFDSLRDEVGEIERTAERNIIEKEAKKREFESKREELRDALAEYKTLKGDVRKEQKRWQAMKGALTELVKKARIIASE